MYILNITLKTFNPKNLNNLNQLITKNYKHRYNFCQNLNISKIIQMKTKHKNFVVLKSPHVHKKSREHFQYKIFKKLYTIKSKHILHLLYFNFLVTRIFSKNCLINTQLIYKK